MLHIKLKRNASTYSILTQAFGLGSGVKRIFFSESGHVAYQIKGKKCRPTCKQTFGPYKTPLTSRIVLKGNILTSIETYFL